MGVYKVPTLFVYSPHLQLLKYEPHKHAVRPARFHHHVAVSVPEFVGKA